MNLDDLERALGVSLPDREVVRQALTHSSYLNESEDAPPFSNERLEFLGDAVIGAATADFLYHRFPTVPEGELTSLRAALVRGRSLAGWARRLGLGEMLLLGKGEESHGAREREALLAATFEALMAAIYLQHGYAAVQEVLASFLPEAIESVLASQAAVDAKTRLQHLCQSRLQQTPVYRIVEAAGPAHRPEYTVEVLVDGRRLATGSGRSKQVAEQAAAAEALKLDFS